MRDKVKKLRSAAKKHPRANAGQKPKHRSVKRALDFPMEVTAKQNDKI
jgi:hypothetical protein